jgi:hypothetical protein
VVDGVDEPTGDEFKVDDDIRCATPLPFCSPWYVLSCFPFALEEVEGRLLLLCNL